MTIRTAGRPTPLIGALAVSLLAFTACGGGADDDASTPEADGPSVETTTEAAEAAVAAFPVGEPFGEAVWSVDVGPGESTVTVRPDRVVVDRLYPDVARVIQAYTPDGDEAWTYDLSEHEYPQHIPVAVLEETVAILEHAEIEASGLDEAQTVTELTLLSIEDGSVVAEIEFPDSPEFTSFGSIVFHGDDGIGFVTEEGEVIEVEAEYFRVTDAGLVRGAPFWLDKGNNLNTQAGTLSELPGIEQPEISGMDVLAVDHRQGLLAVQVTHGALADLAYYVVAVETGEIVYELSCSDYSHTDGTTDVARNSPNGEYVVHESIWMSATGGRCFGGGDGQRTVELRAVDDDGNAYGAVEGDAPSDELVTIPVGGEPEVSDLPEGAPVPSGIMNGDIAVHLSGTTLTGNPIK
ncbi:hypothetical protein [Glycomyces tarimensis]